MSDDTLYDYLGQAVEQGILHSAGRGWYTRHSREAGLNPQTIEELRSLLQARFPLLPHYIWSPLQFNPWLHHQVGRAPSFVYVDADGIEDVADFLREEGWDVHVNPGKRAGLQAGSRNRDVVLRPVRREIGGDDSGLESVLVDFLMENERLTLVDPTEFQEMVSHILSGHKLSLGLLLRKLGDRKRSIQDLINENSTQYLGIA